MTEVDKSNNLSGMIKPSTSRDEFIGAVKRILKPDDLKLMGGEEAPDKIVDSMSYLGVFAPEPATFDKEAFNFTAGVELDEVEGAHIFQFLKQTGVIKPVDMPELMVGQGFRYSVSQDFVNMIKDPKNGFLTED